MLQRRRSRLDSSFYGRRHWDWRQSQQAQVQLLSWLIIGLYDSTMRPADSDARCSVGDLSRRQQSTCSRCAGQTPRAASLRRLPKQEQLCLVSVEVQARALTLVSPSSSLSFQLPQPGVVQRCRHGGVATWWRLSSLYVPCMCASRVAKA